MSEVLLEEHGLEPNIKGINSESQRFQDLGVNVKQAG